VLLLAFSTNLTWSLRKPRLRDDEGKVAVEYAILNATSASLFYRLRYLDGPCVGLERARLSDSMLLFSVTSSPSGNQLSQPACHRNTGRM
jgi:hypothetical protein